MAFAMVASGGLHFAWGIDALQALPDLRVCVMSLLSDHPCPGCGMLRALLRLGQWRFSDASALHPLSLPSAIAIVWIAAGSPGRSRLRALPDAIKDPSFGVAIAIVIGLWALRIAE
jgi:hypothetical protein